MAEPSDKKLGNILIERGYVTAEDVAEALHLQQRIKVEQKQSLKLGQVLVVLKKLNLDQLHDALRGQTTKAAKSREFVAEAKSNMTPSMPRRSPVKKDEPKGILAKVSALFKKN